jgi:hypothetical protein
MIERATTTTDRRLSKVLDARALQILRETGHVTCDEDPETGKATPTTREKLRFLDHDDDLARRKRRVAQQERENR